MAIIAIGGVMHESNTFSAAQTDLAAFHTVMGGEIINVWGEAHHEVSGFIQGASLYGYEIRPVLMASATPAGPVTDEAFNRLAADLIGRIQSIPDLDGILLALHGAMVVESCPDGDGEMLRRIREAVGEDIPIVVTLDHHANVSAQMVEKSTALVIYKTNPHIDQRRRGLQAADILMRTILGAVKPTQALAKPPMIWNILHQNTSKEPMGSILREAEALERRSDVLAANVAAGYPYADVHEIGPSVVIATDNDLALAQREAARLSRFMWEARDQLEISLPDAAEAVNQALQSDRRPVILVEMGDNIGGGSPGDSTFLLSELLRQNAEQFVVVLYAPEAVQECIQAGVRGNVNLIVGGKRDNLHGLPAPISGRVRLIHDGYYEETEPRHGGQRRHDQGLTAVVEIHGRSLIVLTSKRQTPFSLHQLLSLGVDPRLMRYIVVKAAIAYRAAYEPIAGRIIEVDTPGLTAVNPLRFAYRHVRRPLFPLDEDMA
jgi:microcystin degradation protein MlrC